ncbi:MAG TPA: hypothetical protein VLK53_14420 [Gaiellaceae bacterium]|nr:hypothetical protein [Gaiellaceae bacterium]
MHRLRLLVFLGALVGLLAIVPSALSTSAPKGVAGTPLDVLHIGPDVSGLPVQADVQAKAAARQAAKAATVGETRNWLGLDDKYGFYYRKQYTLRGVGQHIEVWVASELNRRAPSLTSLPQVGQSSGTNFLDNDCRNGDRTQITDTQVNYLIGQFDNNIYPKESAAFSVPPDRDGSGAQIALPPPYDPTGDGDHIVVLVDNVRDDNFYDLNNTQGFSYIAGFFSSQLNDFFDRNVMTIDAFDWLHRTGANPPNDPVPGDNCNSAPARPSLYEGTFAHEYQHLLESYEDPDEVNWVNEGLSDWAQTLTGYVNPAVPITKTGFDSHTQCFLGWLGVQTPANPNPRDGGPENSLTRWGDQGDDEILCDYGAAYTFMEFLAGRYGTDFMTRLHRNDDNGLVGLQAVLKQESSKLEAQDVLHDWSLMVALDGLIDDGAKIAGHPREKSVTTPTLHATINWDTPEAYSTPGAPSNGADYVRLRKASGAYFRGDEITSIGFTGATTLPTLPVQWSVDPSPPLQPGDPALYSGAADDRDEAIVRQITVPSGPQAVLTFNAFWNEEEGWDFGFVQVSTDGGVSYQSLTCTDTTTETNPDALPTAQENVPGFTGFSGTWKPETCSLSAYAGQTVLLAFRAFNDPATLGTDLTVPPGFWVDDITVGNNPPISDGSSLAEWQSFTQVRPNPVDNYTVRIISMKTGVKKTTIKVRELQLTGDFNLRGKARVQRYIDKNADFVAAVVFYDDPSETSTQYAPYRLSVNGITQPGGGL